MTICGFQSAPELVMFLTSLATGVTMVIGSNAVNSAPSFMLNYFTYISHGEAEKNGGVPAVPRYPGFWTNILTYYTIITLVAQAAHEPTNLTSFMSRFSLLFRLEVSIVLMLIELLVVLLMPQMGASEGGAMAGIVIVAYLGGAARAYFENTGYALFAPCPSRMLSGMLVGSALSGTIVSVIQLILVFTMKDTYQSVLTQSVLYFSLAMGLIVLCSVLLVALLFNRYARHYVAEFRSCRSPLKNIYRPIGNNSSSNIPASNDDDDDDDVNSMDDNSPDAAAAAAASSPIAGGKYFDNGPDAVELASSGDIGGGDNDGNNSSHALRKLRKQRRPSSGDKDMFSEADSNSDIDDDEERDNTNAAAAATSAEDYGGMLFDDRTAAAREEDVTVIPAAGSPVLLTTTGLDTDGDHGKDHDDDRKNAIPNGGDLADAVAELTAALGPALITSELLQGVRLLPVLRKIWPMMVACFSSFLITYLVYPGIFLAVAPDDAAYTTIVMAVFNVSDLIGRVACLARVLWPPRKVVFVGAIARILLIPPMVLCAAKIIPTQGAAYALTAVLGVSNGFFGTLAMLYAPEVATLATEGERGIAGQVMGACLLLGCAIGSLLQLAIVLPFN